jgi:hypothetical protein
VAIGGAIVRACSFDTGDAEGRLTFDEMGLIRRDP